jgi:antitoxin component of MazEF toxin-antitoxin module
MSRVYKHNDKLVVYLPFDVIKTLGLKEGDEIDFLKYNERNFIVAKKSDILNKILAGAQQQRQGIQERGASGTQNVNEDEEKLLKKLDTLRYNDRTEGKVNTMLSAQEKRVLRGLLEKKAIRLYKKEGESEFKYSISKDVYDRFLFGKREKRQVATEAESRRTAEPVAKEEVNQEWADRLDGKRYLELLETNGYIVVNNLAEAGSLSVLLESSIRSGNVLGTRAFNKKYYIAQRSFINKNAAKVIKVLDKKAMSTQEISRITGIEEDGVRSILYILSESGDISETKRDFFKLV